MKDDEMPDYSQCSLHQLRDIVVRVNREIYPDRFEAVRAEIERRERLGEVANKSDLPPMFAFLSSAGLFFGPIFYSLIIFSAICGLCQKF